MRGCGIREELGWQLHALGSGCRIAGIDLQEKFVTHGSIRQLNEHFGLDGKHVASYLMEVLGDEN